MCWHVTMGGFFIKHGRLFLMIIEKATRTLKAHLGGPNTCQKALKTYFSKGKAQPVRLKFHPGARNASGISCAY